MGISQVRVNYLISMAQSLFDSKGEYGLREECTEALKQWDYNGDGKTSAKELYKNNLELDSFLFSGNKEYEKKAKELSLEQYKLYSKFQGKDGALSAEEYWAALQSQENGELLEQWHALKDVAETEQMLKSSKEGKALKKEIKNSLKKRDENGDGKTSVNELYNDMIELNKAVFKGDKAMLARANEISKQQRAVYAKYSGDDGILSEAEYYTALQSQENGELLEQWHALKYVVETKQKKITNSDKGYINLDDINNNIGYVVIDENTKKV